MRAKNKRLVITGIILVILTAIIALSTYFVKKVYNKQANLDPEILRSMNYKQITDGDSKVEDTDFVKFSAFFTRDLDGDGNAEKLLGTCRRVTEKDQLYIDLNVLTNGYLKNGKITVNSTNFKYSMSMVKDDVLKNNYISNDVKVIELNQINAGTQKLILGDVLPYIGNDTNNYSVNGENEKINSITLTGIHVSDEGVETEISKTIDLTVDWHGETKTDIRAYNEYYNYDNLETETISFSFSLNETQGELLLKDSEAKVTIPALNEFEPTEVKCTNSNIESEYNSETKELTIKRSSECNEKGIITSTLSRNNSYTVEITYPKEAYEAISSYTTLQVPIEGFYVGYNNKNEEFENPYKSNIAKTNIAIIFRETPKGEIYNFDVDFVDKKYVSDPLYKYIISKQYLLNLYDSYNAEDKEGEVEDKEESKTEIKNKEYVVRWHAVRGDNGDVPSMVMSETKSNTVTDIPYGDKWDTIVMENYVTNTGIYFEDIDSILEEDGTISVYNDDTNELIHKFTKEEWNNYSRNNPYKYESPVRHIRAETSKTKLNGRLSVYNVKELELEKILKDFTKEQVKDINIVHTYLTGVCNIEGQSAGVVYRTDSVNYVAEKSNSNIYVQTNKLSTQDVLNNQRIYIDTLYKEGVVAKWQNGEFLVEIPKEIINMNIKSVSVNNSKVKIVAYDLLKKDDKYFVKIITENETPETYRITIDCTMTPDPRQASSTRQIRLYDNNQYCNEYYFEAQDKYDVDSDNNTNEKVGTATTDIELISPTSLITLETITNYDDKQDDEITIAPNIAEITRKTNETKEATINISLSNNYPNTVSGVQILGKIPFEGNTYILNQNEMESKFTTTMKNQGITIPKELQEKAVVYYSENENPDKNLEDSKNGWKSKEEVQDFSKIKTYLIDLAQYTIQVGKTYVFNYTVNIPDKIEHNLASYSDHAVYYELDTDGGKLQLSTEPNKVGIRAVRKYKLELTKTKENFESLKVSGATYKIEYTDIEGNERARILTTDSNGNINMDELYIGITYKITEIRSPENYVLNSEEIEFTVVEDEQGKLKLETENNEEIILNEQDNKVQINIQEEPKYNITITKIDDSTKEPIENVRFRINGQIFTTNRAGQVTVTKLLQNQEYVVVEEEARGYYTLKEDITFRLAKDENGNMKIESNNETFRNARIQNTDEEDLIQIDNISITNEKIPTYDLQILKVEENLKEEDITKLTPLKGARFKLTHEDLDTERQYYTDGNGNINIPNLYQYVEGKDLTGKYILQELEAPNGYANDMEEISFRTMLTEEGTLNVEIENRENLNTIRDVQVEDGTIKIIIQDKPLFTLIKTDSETGKTLAGAQFVIYELDEKRNEVGPARDVNGKPVGILNEDGKYVVTTDETGKVVLPLRDGLYKAVEVGYPEGYLENDNEQYFKISEGKEEEQEDEQEIIEINTIEDLVRLSNDVNSGNNYDGKIVKLMRTLDFEEETSYNDPDDKSFGDVNGNGQVEGIKQELTNKSIGYGFIPIGNSERYYFSGTFDGQGNEIRNLYIETSMRYIGLFGNVTNGNIKNVGVTGNIIHSSTQGGTNYIGGIIGYANNSNINSCYSTMTIKENIPYGSQNSRVGGIIGAADNSRISDSYNEGNISCVTPYSASVGGIIGFSNNGKISKCYNIGKITSSIDSYNGGNIGGILGYGNSDIEDCYNSGSIDGILKGNSTMYIGGINGSYSYSSIIDNCYNTGNINGVSTGSYKKIIVDGISFGDNSKNNYYLETISLTGDNIKQNGQPVSERDMCSIEFYNILNKNNVWTYRKNSYPRLNIAPGSIRIVTNLEIKNTLKKFNITTEIAPNSKNRRIGGTISGDYNDNYKQEDNVKYVETVTYNETSINPINIIPQSGYIIDKIYINNKEVEFTKDENGSVIIPIGYFNNVKEDYHIAVKFEENPNLIIHKVDEDDPNIKIPNVKFRLEYNENIDPSRLIDEMSSDSTYKFTKTNDNYISANKGISNSTANAYFPIDLANQTGTFTLVVNASISSESNCDFGYATITTTANVPAYSEDSNDINTKERFIYISGTQNYYTGSVTLTGGKRYYLHIGYRKDGSVNKDNDTFTINGINLYGNALEKSNSEVETDSNGEAKVGVPINRDIKITELNTPKGYIPRTDSITVQVGDSGVKEVEITNKKVDNQIIINKKDKNTNEPIQGVKFVIYNVDEENKEIDFAKDYNDNYFGTQEGDRYVLTTDEQGQINVRPKPGMYKAVEVETAEGYVLDEDEICRTTYFKIENPGIYYNESENQNETESSNADLHINNIEDLVRFANAVNSGTSYKGKTIKLARTLDFSDDSSYNNPNDTSFGDYNGDGTTEGIKAELTKESEIGFKAIGINENTPFKGTFDGQGYEIKNIHINNSKNGKYSGLFGNVESGKILNLGLVGGEIRNNNVPAGAIVGGTLKNSVISNCYNASSMIGGGQKLGGIAYNAEDSTIINCYNSGNINSPSGCAGIVANVKNSIIKNCQNEVDINGTGGGASGIVYDIEDSEIVNCYNKGNVTAPGGAYGIARNITNTTIKNCYNTGDIPGTGGTCTGIALNVNNSKIIDCYNKGNVTAPGGAYGVAYSVTSESVVSNCYNTGNLQSTSPVGGIAHNIVSNSIVSNCYNEGNINNNAPAGGIAYDVRDSKINNCYNKGNITSSGGPVGGLSYAINNSLIFNCYNTGDLINNGNSPSGGVAYQVKNSTVENFYNTGVVTSNAGLIGGIAEEVANNQFTNCYYLNTTAEKGIYQKDDIKGVVDAKNEDEMKSEEFADLLNSNRKNIKSDIGLLSWRYKEESYPEMVGIKAEKSITITNNRASKVIVHHYLEGTGPDSDPDNYIEPVTFEEAPDEVLIGKEGDVYTTSPNMNIKDYGLAKGEDGEYRIPENASGNYPMGTYEDGKYVEGETHVYYYYRKKKLELTVHHYIEGTENKVPLGKDEQGEDKFAEDEHSEYDEGDHYKTTPSEEVLQKYKLVQVVGDEEKDITTDEVVTYYYRIKEHEITTRVEIPEERAEDEKGGKISGEGEKPYETVEYEKASTKDITITPDPGYRIKQIRLVSTNEEGNKTESIIYINGSQSEKEETEKAEITYKNNIDGSLILTKFYNMTEDKEVIVVFEKDEGKVIVHHYIEGTTDQIYDDQVTIKPVGTKVETLPIKKDNYVLVKEPADRNATITKETQEKTYYYQEQYKITTEVIKHKESYKDGTTMNDVRGGQIEDEGKEAHELVLKNRSNQEEIEVIPDPGYEIVSIIIKDGQEAKDGINIDFDQYKEKDENGKKTGKVILPVGLFPSMQSDKHIQVEFRKKTNIIVKHLEEGTEDVLYQTEQGKDYEELTGYEGQEFETSRKVIPNYMAAEIEIIESTSEGEGHVSKVGVTNENKDHMTKYNKVQTDEKTYVNGEMYADTLTIVYWYTRVPSGIIVRHIETNEKAEEKEIESKLVDGLAGLEQPTTRYKYDKYIPVDRKEENKGNTNENITIMGKDQNSKTLTFAEDKTLEVWYFYEKEYNVTTEVKPHEEKVLNEETKEYETVLKDGGTISKRYEKDEQGNDKLDDKGNKIETVYEKILSRGDSKEEIEIKPDDGYKIKTVIKQKKVIVNGKETSEDEKVFIENMIKEDGSVILPEGQLTDVQNDYNIVVEFERITAKVIVEYKDAYTKETIHEDKEIPGFVNDKYNESRIEIESYIPADPEPENSEGKMTEETITVTYWYTKQFKITAEVKPHEEEEHNPETGETTVVQKDGGTIKIGEDLPEEIVTRGESSTQKIIATPEEYYRIKTLTVNDKQIEISNLIKEDGTLELPLFKNMQEDKHIVVEFERIPAKVIVKHLDEETNEPIVDDEIVDGYISKDYETDQKNLKYYKLVEEKYPENYKGTMTKEDITVTYYYKKLGFNMKIEKEIQSIKLNGQEVFTELENNKNAKIEIKYKEIADTQIEIAYKIKVTNTEKISGTAIVEEVLPEGFELINENIDESNAENSNGNSTEKVNENWSIEEGRYLIQTEEIKPQQTKEYRVILRWRAEANNKGKKVNTARIVYVDNEPGYGETTLEDNEDTAIVEIRIDKTMQEIINDAKDDIKDGKIGDAIQGVARDVKDKITNVKTGDAIIVSVVTLLIAGVTILIIIKRKRQ